jgi:hypothetical protein
MLYIHALFFLIFDPFGDHDEDSYWYSASITILFYVFLLPFGLVLDLISLPFHLLNVLRRVCMGVPYSPYYYYDCVLRTPPITDPTHHDIPGSRSRVESFVCPADTTNPLPDYNTFDPIFSRRGSDIDIVV